MFRLVQIAGECLIIGTSADVKPTATAGFAFFETDTSKCFLANGVSWTEVLNSSYKLASDTGAVWGSITGTLANQTDLQNALNLKANLTSPGPILRLMMLMGS